MGWAAVTAQVTVDKKRLQRNQVPRNSGVACSSK